MSNHSWLNDPLSYLIGAISYKEFFASYYEQTSLHCTHNKRDHFADLLTIDRVDEIISTSELPPGSLQMARTEPSISRANYTFNNGNIDRGAVIHHYQQGATVILPQLHLADENLAHFCRAMENQLSTLVQTNIYLTPPGNQGFNTHYDDHDVFVIQVAGEKHWRLYQKPIENPYRGENFKPNTHDVGESEQEFLLKMGDCVYIPRGLMHDAVGHGDEPSLHITVGLIVKSWADLMLESLSEVAMRNSKFRRSLPPGFAREDFDSQEAADYFAQLIDDYKQQADFAEVFELFKQNFVKQSAPDLRGGLLNESIELSEGDQFIRRKNSQALLRHDDEEVVIVCGGGDVHFDLAALPGLQSAFSNEAFSLKAFVSLEDDEARDVLKKLIAFGLIERQ
jgi:ribosomal protein L16 Arg81 hydroxylase